MKTNLIKDWDIKLSKIVETDKDLKIMAEFLLAITYFEKLLQTANKKGFWMCFQISNYIFMRN